MLAARKPKHICPENYQDKTMGHSSTVHPIASHSKSLFWAIGHDELYLPHVTIDRKNPNII